MEASPPPGFEDLGLPREGGEMGLTLGGVHAPGSRLGFEIGMDGGEAAVNRRFVWSLWDERRVVDRDEASVGVLRAGDRVRLGVRVPPRAPASYRLRLKITAYGGVSRTFLWPVEVPEQSAAARLVIEPVSLRRGETFTATLHNDGPTELVTGEDYALERLEGGTWERVHPFDGDDTVAWAAVGLLIAPGGRRDFRIEVPRLTRPGPHRMVKRVSAETARVRERRVTADFDVAG